MSEPQTSNIRRTTKYSLKIMLFSNCCSFMGGLIIHYLIEHHRF